ncbi:unnamed protein product [Onchocerca flexuosa]|uniref:Uncharacterized protein n=1 Tax=Onchocerca flexuosa TaxID=387005 RepID=A0A183HDJ2_9BILA|nr:unnamed protein product [Onchocerca flexuosa]
MWPQSWDGSRKVSGWGLGSSSWEKMERRRISNSMEEEAGVLKSGYVTAAFSPVKTKKVYFAVLGHRALELHESEKKSQRKNRQPRHLIDLSTCFNINRHILVHSLMKLTSNNT